MPTLTDWTSAQQHDDQSFPYYFNTSMMRPVILLAQLCIADDLFAAEGGGGEGGEGVLQRWEAFLTREMNWMDTTVLLGLLLLMADVEYLRRGINK